MAGRIRTIKPEVLEDEIAAGLSDAAWRLWVASWVLADDYGNVRAGSQYLGAHVWQNTSKDIDAPLHELIRKGRFQPYSVKGQRYAHIHAFDRHQRVDNAGKPRVPGPEEDDGTWKQLLRPILADSSATTVGDPQDSPLARRARAQSSRGTSDLRPPTPTTDPPPAAIAAVAANGTNGTSKLKYKLPSSEIRLWGEHRKNLYAAAVARALEDTWGFDDKQLRVMHDVIAAHCVDKTKIDEWLDAVVFAFVTAIKNEEAKYWSFYQPKGLLSWLNGGGARKRNDGNGASSTGVTRQVVNGRVVDMQGNPVDE